MFVRGGGGGGVVVYFFRTPVVSRTSSPDDNPTRLSVSVPPRPPTNQKKLKNEILDINPSALSTFIHDRHD